MDQPPITVDVHLTQQGFRDFYLFDALARKRGWLRPVVFACAMCAIAAVCFVFQSRQRGTAALGAVLLVVGLGLPAVFFGSIFGFVSRQVKALKLDQGPKHIATVTLSDQGVVVEGGKEPLRYGWEEVYAAYRMPQAVYLYVGENQAHMLPDADVGDPQALWALLTAHLPAHKLVEKG